MESIAGWVGNGTRPGDGWGECQAWTDGMWMGGVGVILVPCVKYLYRPALALQTYHAHYKSGIL